MGNAKKIDVVALLESQRFDLFLFFDNYFEILHLFLAKKNS